MKAGITITFKPAALKGALASNTPYNSADDESTDMEAHNGSSIAGFAGISKVDLNYGKLAYDGS